MLSGLRTGSVTDLQVVVRGELSLSGSALQGLPRGWERGSAALRGVIGNVEINVGSLQGTPGLEGAGDAIPTPSYGV